MSIGEIISALALVISFIVLIRSVGKDSKADSTSLTTVIVKLENIGAGITEIKNDIKGVKNDVRDHGERITRAEQKIKHLEKMVGLYHQGETPGE